VQGVSVGQGMGLWMDHIARARCRPAPASMGALSYQDEDRLQPDVQVFGLCLLRVYLVLAGQYEAVRACSRSCSRAARGFWGEVG